MRKVITVIMASRLQHVQHTGELSVIIREMESMRSELQKQPPESGVILAQRWSIVSDAGPALSQY